MPSRKSARPLESDGSNLPAPASSPRSEEMLASAARDLRQRSRPQIDYSRKTRSSRATVPRRTVSRKRNQKATDLAPRPDEPEEVSNEEEEDRQGTVLVSASDLNDDGDNIVVAQPKPAGRFVAPRARSPSLEPDEASSRPSGAVEKQSFAVEEDDEFSEFDGDQIQSSIRVDLFDVSEEPDSEADNAVASSQYASDDVSKCPAAERRQRNLRVLDEEGIIELVCVVVETDTDEADKATLRGMTEESICSTAAKIGLMADRAVFRSVVAGTLARDVHTDPRINIAVSKMRKEATTDKDNPRPAHYINLLVDDHGRSPTPNQLLAALGEMREYVGSKSDNANARACQIDGFRRKKMSPMLSSAEYWKRRYLNDNDGERVLGRDKHFATFYTALSKRLKAIAGHLRDLPLQHPLAELGYTHKSQKRLKAHRNHTNSTFLMNLMEAILGLLYPGIFSIAQFVVFLCTRAAQGAIGELFLSLISQAYIRTAGGFNYYGAGRSVESVYGLTSNDWDRFFQWQKRNVDSAGSKVQEMKLRQESEARAQEADIKGNELQPIPVDLVGEWSVGADEQTFDQEWNAATAAHFGGQQMTIDDTRITMGYRKKFQVGCGKLLDFLLQAQSG